MKILSLMTLISFQTRKIFIKFKIFMKSKRYIYKYNIIICILKMNEGLMGLERHEGESLMTELSFLGELSL